MKALKEQKSTEYKKKYKIPEKSTIAMIEEDSERIALKALEVALVNEEYLKVIKWGYFILINPKYDKNERALMARARAYIELNQF